MSDEPQEQPEFKKEAKEEIKKEEIEESKKEGKEEKELSPQEEDKKEIYDSIKDLRPEDVNDNIKTKLLAVADITTRI